MTTPLIRFYRGYNSNGTVYQGDIYIYENDTLALGVPTTPAKVKGMIRQEHGQTLMCIYTVPAGYTGYFIKGYVSLALNRSGQSAAMVWKARLFGGVFLTKSAIGLNSAGNSSWQYEYLIPLALPEKTDVKITCDEVTANGTALSGGFTVLLVENT